MELFDSKRQERLEAARKASTASKEAARAFLIRAGILLPNGAGIESHFDIYPIPGNETKNNPNMTQNPKY